MLQALVVKRLALVAVTTLATTVVPVLLQDRPVLKWTWDKIGPRVVTRVTDRLEPAPAEPAPKAEPTVIVVPAPQPAEPERVNVTLPVYQPYQPACHVNPHDYCRYHWWTAGPVRRVVSFPVRFIRFLFR